MRHNCDVLRMWVADPRIPIEFRNQSEEYILTINPSAHIAMAYCLFCGAGLARSSNSSSLGEHLCEHVSALANEPESSVIYRDREKEYWILGQDSHMIRLFYCPICGCKLPLQKDDSRFCEKDPTEVVELSNRLQTIKTIEQATELLGPPDTLHGTTLDHLYPGDTLMRIGHKRSLFYNHLAKTITVVVYELLDGSVEIKLARKEKI